MLSQPLDLVGTSVERASYTSESVRDTLHIRDEGRGRELMFGREKEVPVKTE